MTFKSAYHFERNRCGKLGTAYVCEDSFDIINVHGVEYLCSHSAGGCAIGETEGDTPSKNPRFYRDIVAFRVIRVNEDDGTALVTSVNNVDTLVKIGQEHYRFLEKDLEESGLKEMIRNCIQSGIEFKEK